jgi:uncharacterized membrane protein
MTGVPDRSLETTPGESLDRPAALPNLAGAALSWLRSLNFFQSLFLVYMVLGLLITTFLIPPFQKSDEPSHYFRTISISNLDLACSKDRLGVYKFEMKAKYADLPETMHVWDVAINGTSRFDPDWLRADFSNPLLNEEKRVYDICNLPPLGYLPNVVGVWMGKPFENPLIGFYLGRFMGVIFFVAATIFAIRLTPPRYRLPIYFFAALPVVLHQAGAFTYDVVQLPLFLVLYGYLMKFVTEDKRVDRWDLVAFLACLVVAINIRSLTYLPLMGLFLAIPVAKVATSWKRYIGITSAFVAVSAVVTIAFSAIYLPRVSAIPVVEGDVSTQRQLTFIYENPGKMLDASYRALQNQGEWLLWQTIGVHGWIDAPMSYLPYYLMVFVLGLVFYQVMREDRRVVGLPQVGWIFVTIACTVVTLFLSLYLVWTPVGFTEVLGLQGRYFIGLLPFAIFAVSQLALIAGRRRFINAMLLLLAVVLVYNMYRTIDLRYYGPDRPALVEQAPPDGPAYEAPPPEVSTP